MASRPINTVVISTRLSEGVPERIDAVAGRSNRAEFIREAIESALQRAEHSPVEYQLERMEPERDEKWVQLLQRWHDDHRRQQEEMDTIKDKINAIADIIVLQIAPGAGRNKFKKAWAMEFLKHFGEKARQDTEGEDA